MNVEPQSKQSQDQVALFNLLFSMSWEDPESDRRALAIVQGETVMTVTSGGCNTLTLLLEDPGKIFAVDINPTQTYLLELKCAAIRRLDYDSLHAFLGLTPSGDRLRVFEDLSEDLSEDAATYWKAKAHAVRHGVIYAGKYESFLRLFVRLVNISHGRKRTEALFRCETLAQQQTFFEMQWNRMQWRLLLKLLASKPVIARALTVDYFQFDDGSTSLSESILRRARHVICEIPVQSNYFLARYLLGRYLNEVAVPAYLRKESLPLVKQRLNRIEIITAPARDWLASQAEGSIDAFSLSNICELMSVDETGRLFTEVARSGRAGARICFRNLIVPRGVPESLAQQIVLDEDLSHDLVARDRSFVYSRVQAFKVKKDAAEQRSR